MNIPQLNLMLVEPYSFINNKLSYKLRRDLCIYESNELESKFIEIAKKNFHWFYL